MTGLYVSRVRGVEDKYDTMIRAKQTGNIGLLLHRAFYEYCIERRNV